MLKKYIPIILFALLLAGLFWSRALLSLTQALWVGYALFQLKNFKDFSVKNPLLVWSCLPLLFWFPGAWQQPLEKSNFDYALTLAAYPATVLIVQTTPRKIIENHWLKLWLSATVIGLAYPLFWYFTDFTAAHKAYGLGQTLPTFMDTDHVRFSIFLCSSFLLLLCFPIFKKNSRIIAALLLFIAILFLSVRTGWALALTVIFLYAVLQIKESNKIQPLHFLLGIVSLIALLSLAYWLFPTIQQKIAYTIWDWQQFQPGKYDPNYSDGTRRAINYAAWKSIENGNGSNTGWAGITAALSKSFGQYFRGVELNFGWPFNQFLFWWMGSGWWGMLLFTGWLFYPAIQGWRDANKGLVCWTIAIAVSCLAEATLNYQYGVFLHIWPLAFLWNRKTISIPGNS